MDSFNSEASEVSPGDFIPTIVPIGKSSTPRIESEIERDYLKTIESTIHDVLLQKTSNITLDENKQAIFVSEEQKYNFQNSKCQIYDSIVSNTHFNKEITDNINSNTDFLNELEKFVESTFSFTYGKNNILIVDFENLSFKTIGRRDQLFKVSNNKNRYNDRDGFDFVPNVASDEIIEFRAATFLLLNYAQRNQYEIIIPVFKTSKIYNYFVEDFQNLKTNHLITITNGSRNPTISATLNANNELQRYLDNVEIYAFKINSDGDPFSIDFEKIKLISNADLKYEKTIHDKITHNFKGNDDALIMMIYWCLLNEFQKKADVNRKLDSRIKLLSADGYLEDDFFKNYKYILPFSFSIKHNHDFDRELVNVSVSFQNPANLTKIQTIPSDFKIERANFNLYTNIFNDYYNLSKNNNVNNWYMRNTPSAESSLSIIASLNTKQPTEEYELIDYMDLETRQPALNQRNKPYLDPSGKVATLEHNKIPYCSVESILINPNDRLREYSYRYHPSLHTVKEKNYEPYKDKEGNVNKINVYNSTTKTYEKQNYCLFDSKLNIWKPNLKLDGTPYTDRNKQILTIFVKPNTFEPYCYMDANGKYVPNLKERVIGTREYPYTDASGQIDKIRVYKWQPYLNKYNINESSDSNNSYYTKYLKYKAKYNNLKKKFGL